MATTHIEVKCSIPYALRNEGAAAIGEPALRRLAADRIEQLEKALAAMFKEYEGVYDKAVPTTHQSDAAKAAERLAREALGIA